MLTSLSLLLALAAGQSAEPAASAAVSEEHHVTVFSGGAPSRDADGDGFVSREEFTAPLAEAFARLDTDNDGRLSEDERRAGHHEIRMSGTGAGGMHGDGPWIRRLGDADGVARTVIVEGSDDGPARFRIESGAGDGARRFEIVTADGAHHGMAPRMIRRGPARDGETRTVIVEADGDGPPRVTVNGQPVEGDEADVIVREISGPPGGGGHIFMRRPGGADRAVVELDEGGGRHEVFIRRMGGPGHAGLDKDGDGKISEEEFVAPLREAFREMDADHSGAIEEGEHGPAHD